MTNQESGAGKPSFGAVVKELTIPEYASLPYKWATAVTKIGEMALILGGLGAIGIGVVTKALDPKLVIGVIDNPLLVGVSLGTINGLIDMSVRLKKGSPI